MIKKIDIQLSNICNRTCGWCPHLQMSKMDKVMNSFDFEKVVDFISQNIDNIKPNCKITLGRYNEPLLFYDKVIEYNKILKNKFSNFIITLNTNGDLLNSEMNIDKLLEDIDLFIVNRYECEDINISTEKIFSIFKTNIIDFKYNDEIKQFTFKYKNTYIEWNMEKHKTMNIRNRAGALNIDTKRMYPCNIVGKILSIDVDGKVFPCCELCGTFNLHEKLSCGNIFSEDQLTNNILENIDNFDTNNEFCNRCIAEEKMIFGDNI